LFGVSTLIHDIYMSFCSAHVKKITSQSRSVSIANIRHSLYRSTRPCALEANEAII